MDKPQSEKFTYYDLYEKLYIQSLERNSEPVLNPEESIWLFHILFLNFDQNKCV